MEKFSLIFCVVLLPTIVQGSLIKREGTEILVKHFNYAPIQQHGNKYSNRNVYTAVKEEVANMGDNGDKDDFINGIRSFVKAKRQRREDLGIGNQSSSIVEDLHARGVKKITDAPVIRKIPKIHRAVLMTTATPATAPAVTPATAPAATPATAPEVTPTTAPAATPATAPATTSPATIPGLARATTPATTPATPPATPPTTPQIPTRTAAAAATPLPKIKWPKITFCKLLLFLCKSFGKEGWLFNG